MENKKSEEKLLDFLGQITNNLNSEDEILKFYTNKIYVELSHLLNNFGIEYGKTYFFDLINTYIFYQYKAKLNYYKNDIQSINEDMKNFYTKGIDKGFNELECQDKTAKYLSSINYLNSATNYDDVFLSTKAIVLSTFKFENQQMVYQLDSILNTNKSLLEMEINKLRASNKSICKQIGDLIIKLGEMNSKKDVNLDSWLVLIEKLLVDINNKNSANNKLKLNNLFTKESEELSQDLSKITRNISDKAVFAKEILDIFVREMDRLYNSFYEKLNNELVPMISNETLIGIRENKIFNVSRNTKIMSAIKKFSSDYDLVDMDVVFANIETLIMTKYGLSRGNPNYQKAAKIFNLKKAKIENYVQGLEGHILLNNIIELQAQIDRLLNHRTINAPKDN